MTGIVTSFWREFQEIAFASLVWLTQTTWTMSVFLAAALALFFLLAGRISAGRSRSFSVRVLFLLPLFPAFSLLPFADGSWILDAPMVRYSPTDMEGFAPTPLESWKGMRIRGIETVALPSEESKAVGLGPFLVLLYFSGASLFGVRLFVGRRRIASWVRSGLECNHPRVRKALDEAVRSMGTRLPIRIIESHEVPIPIAVGILRPTILLPLGYQGRLEDDQLKLVFIHEITHLENRDPLILHLCRFLCGLFFFNPLLWIFARTLQHSMEWASDERTVCHSDPHAYARLLCRTQDVLHPDTFLQNRESNLGFAFDPSRLKVRVEKVLASTSRNTWAPLAGANIVLVGLMLFGFFIATDVGALLDRPSPSPTDRVAPRVLTLGADGPYRTVTEAISHARSGDSIQLEPGMKYCEDLQIPTSLTLLGDAESPPAILGRISFNVVGCSLALNQIEISNPNGSGLEILDATGSKVTVTECFFRSNRHNGVFANSSDLLLTLVNSDFIRNGSQGIHFTGSRENPIPRGSEILVEGCHFSENGQAWSTVSTGRGRAIQLTALREGSLTVKDSEILVTKDGARDRGIHLDGRSLIDNRYTIRNCLIESPQQVCEASETHSLGIGIKIKAAPKSIVVDNCRIRGFKHSAEFKTRNQPTDIRVTNSEFTGFKKGRGLIFQQVRGKISIDRVVLMGYGGDEVSTGDEALRIKECSGLTADIRNVVAGNTEEGITIDQCPHIESVNISRVVLHKGSGRGEQGIKVDGNDSSRIIITNASINEYQTGLECFSKGGKQFLQLSDSQIRAAKIGVRTKGKQGSSRNNNLILARCLLAGGVPSRTVSTGIFVEDEACSHRIEIDNTTIHRFDHCLRTQKDSNARIRISRTIFSDWTHVAIDHRGGGIVDEDFNVFVNAEAIPSHTASPALARGSNSRHSDDPEEVFANLDEKSEYFLLPRMGGPASDIDGSSEAGALPAWLAENLLSRNSRLPSEEGGLGSTHFDLFSLKKTVNLESPVHSQDNSKSILSPWRFAGIEIPVSDEFSFIQEHFSHT